MLALLTVPRSNANRLHDPVSGQFDPVTVGIERKEDSFMMKLQSVFLPLAAALSLEVRG
jgi:hypothetical protein